MKNVLLLLCAGTEIFEAAAFYDVMGWAGTYGAEKVTVTTVGLEAEVICTFGLKVIPDKFLQDIRVAEFDALAVPGGFETHGFYHQAYSTEVSTLIREFNAARKPIAAICVGALPLAHSGILAGRQATTYHLMGGKRRTQLASFNVNVSDTPIVRDGHIITSTSPATAIEVALTLLAELTGKANADQIRHLMGFPQE